MSFFDKFHQPNKCVCECLCTRAHAHVVPPTAEVIKRRGHGVFLVSSGILEKPDRVQPCDHWLTRLSTSRLKDEIISTNISVWYTTER